MLLEIVDVLERDETYLNLSPYGEPQLGRRGLYRSVGGSSNVEEALLWVLNLSDGTKSLLQIALRAGIPFATIRDAAEQLAKHGLLKQVS